MCKEDWCVGLGQERVAWGYVGTVWNTLKGVEQKWEEGKQRFLKRGDKLGQGVGALKGGLEPPYKLCKLFVTKEDVTSCQKLEFTTLFQLFKSCLMVELKIVQARNNCHMPGFCASIVLVLILGVELFDCTMMGGSEKAWLKGAK